MSCCQLGEFEDVYFLSCCPLGEFEDVADDDSDSGSEFPSSTENLILPALQYLKRCCGILSSMWTMPACPVFHSARR